MSTKPVVRAIDASSFANFCPVSWEQEVVQVPIITHVVERQPIIQERVSQRVEYTTVPVQHRFEQIDYEVQVLGADCAPAINVQKTC